MGGAGVAERARAVLTFDEVPYMHHPTLIRRA
jgi:hypothetical protein